MNIENIFNPIMYYKLLREEGDFFVRLWLPLTYEKKFGQDYIAQWKLTKGHGYLV